MGEVNKAESVHQTMTMIILLAICCGFAVMLYYFYMNTRTVVIPPSETGMRPEIGEDSVTSFKVDDKSETIRSLQRGDVVAFQAPGMSDVGASRVAAVAGEAISIENGQVKARGRLLAGIRNSVGNAADTGTVIIPKGTVYLINDKYSKNVDSLSVGPIPLRFIKGKIPDVPDFGAKKNL